MGDRELLAEARRLLSRADDILTGPDGARAVGRAPGDAPTARCPMADLAPCPFCGSTEAVTVLDVSVWTVQCRASGDVESPCGEGPIRYTESSAIDAWSRRAGPDWRGAPSAEEVRAHAERHPSGLWVRWVHGDTWPALVPVWRHQGAAMTMCLTELRPAPIEEWPDARWRPAADDGMPAPWPEVAAGEGGRNAD